MRFLKLVCALIGAGFGIVGEQKNNSILVWIGIGFLAAAVLLRFVERRKA